MSRRLMSWARMSWATRARIAAEAEEMARYYATRPPCACGHRHESIDAEGKEDPFGAFYAACESCPCRRYEPGAPKTARSAA
jgi:hypothetical protein